MKFTIPTLAALAAALFLAAPSFAATIQDVQALGFQVGVARQSATCTVYVISGFGIDSLYADTCSPDYQATIDSLANPAAQCNRVWQSQHADQHDALNALVSRGYVVSGDQCADRYTVTGPNGTIYSGPGAGLVALAASPDPAPSGQAPAAAAAPAVGGTTTTQCLPLCSDGLAPPTDATPADPAPIQTTEPATTETAGPTTASAPAAPKATNVSGTVTSADVDYALANPNGASQNPLLAATLQSAFNRNVVIASVTRCWIGAKRASCRLLFSKAEGASVKMTIYGATAQTIVLRPR